MKTIPTALQTHLNQQVTTLATCWVVTRIDGTIFRFTDHDKDLVVSGNTYTSAIGYNRSNIASNSDLSVDNLDLEGIIDSEILRADDLRAGKFDGAEVKIFMVNYVTPSQGEIKLRRGWIGEVSTADSRVFKAELRGMLQMYSQRVGEIYSPECRADFGDARCTIPVNPPILQRSQTVVVTDPNSAAVAQYYRVPPYYPTTGDIRIQQSSVGSTELESLADAISGAVNDFVVGVSAHPTVQVVQVTPTYILVEAITPGTAGNSIATTEVCANGSWTASTLQGGLDSPPTRAQGQFNIIGVFSYSNTITIGTTVYRFIYESDYPQSTMQNRIFRVTQAGTTAVTKPTYNYTVGQSTTDGNAILIAEEAWTRHAAITGVTNRYQFTINVTEPRGVNNWFNYGGIVFETGPNKGIGVEVKLWVDDTNTITLFTAVPFLPLVGDLIKIHRGCDKRFQQTCDAVFNNTINFRGEPFIPGHDELFKYPDAH